MGNFLIEEVLEISQRNELSKLDLDTAHFMSSAISLYKNMDLKKQFLIQKLLFQKDC